MSRARLAALLVAIAAPAAGHHSFAMFDQTRKLVLKGTVAAFQWTNPHAFLELDVPGAGGASTHWSIELNSPNNLTRQGWRRTSIKPGDIVSVTINPLRNGKPGGLFNAVVLADGKVLTEKAFETGKPINVPGAN
ncbi:DUF6152 family protein [Sphingobium nicotianae]|uniref:Uncharacterized protein n=1 Tax=Sphingobium nicotianae TaxID=2782607 RepID=A0A9X1D9T4_9SPHN|nr:DUF6152 family protein [Sphingobium nicotianae]MBT2185960.1 hypothetical protein [Sphingobium nicotianae]